MTYVEHRLSFVFGIQLGQKTRPELSMTGEAVALEKAERSAFYLRS